MWVHSWVVFVGEVGGCREMPGWFSRCREMHGWFQGCGGGGRVGMCLGGFVGIDGCMDVPGWFLEYREVSQWLGGYREMPG